MVLRSFEHDLPLMARDQARGNFSTLSLDRSLYQPAFRTSVLGSTTFNTRFLKPWRVSTPAEPSDIKVRH